MPPERTSKGNEEGVSGCGMCCFVLSSILVILFFPISLIFALKIVQEYERVVIFRLGRVIAGGARGPGLFFVFPCIDEFEKVDLRTMSMDIAPQEILTKDSVTVVVDAVIFARIFDPVLATCNVANAKGSTNLLAATTLRNVLGTKNMSELLAHRDEIADHVQVIAAEGEQRASRALKEAAGIMTQSETALQLRYLQTIGTIAAEKESIIMFPIPLDMPIDSTPSQHVVTQF